MSQVLLMRSLVVVVAGGGGRGNVIARIAYFFLTIGCHILDRAECDRCGAVPRTGFVVLAAAAIRVAGTLVASAVVIRITV
jgi:hypothetical protein